MPRLLDRWDGSRLVRVLTIRGTRVPAAMEPVGPATAPGLAVTVPVTALMSGTAALWAAVAGQFAVPPLAWDALLQADPALAALAHRSPEIRPLGLSDPFTRWSGPCGSATRVRTGRRTCGAGSCSRAG